MMIFVDKIYILRQVKLIVTKKSLPISFLLLSPSDSKSGWTILHISRQARTPVTNGAAENCTTYYVLQTHRLQRHWTPEKTMGRHILIISM
jgi:hypothetical protein